MLSGQIAGLRARLEEDVALLHTELYDNIADQARSDDRPWQPFSPGHAWSPFAVAEPAEGVTHFSVVELSSGDLAGAAQLWGISPHNRSAHLGLSLRPGYRGRGLGADVVRTLCTYGFSVRGLHRLQLETLSDNAPMAAAAVRAGFRQEGVMRQAAWVYGAWVDTVVFGLLAEDWHAQG